MTTYSIPASRHPDRYVGQAILLGAWRGLMAAGGLRGLRASAMFAVIRLANDQTLENITGQGAPPWTWPRDELVIDVMHYPGANSPKPSEPGELTPAPAHSLTSSVRRSSSTGRSA